MNGRKCKKCLQEKPESEFGIHSKYKDRVYLRSICKACDVIKSTGWRKSNPERYNALSIQASARWRAKNRESYNAAMREKRAQNIDVYLVKESEKRARNPECYRNADARYKKNHPEAVKAKNDRYRKANPEVYRIKAKIRRDIIRACGGGYTKAEWDAIVSTHPNCQHCLRPWSDTFRPTVDHIIPITRGGANTASNLQPLCKSCNSKKGNRMEYANAD